MPLKRVPGMLRSGGIAVREELAVEISERVRLAGVGNLWRTVFDQWLLTFFSFDKTTVKDSILKLYSV